MVPATGPLVHLLGTSFNFQLCGEAVMFRTIGGAMLVGAVALLADPSTAQAQRRTEAGALRCTMGPSIGAVIASRQRLRCRFTSRGKVENYSGSITRFGLDVGFTAGGVMGWIVLARTRSLGRGALAGNYVGASGDISLGVGAGANMLIGGSRRSVMLQPVSVVGQIGVNLALGVAGLSLRFTGSSPGS
jgi:uncharacterized protein DUF992